MAKCVSGEAVCVPGMAAGRGLIAGVRSGPFRLRRRETGPPAGKDSPRPRPGRSAQTEGLGEGTGSEEQGQNGQAIPSLDLADSGASWPQGRLVLGRHNVRVVDALLLEADHFGEAQAGQ